MCLFPLPNNNIDSLAYKKGVVEFDCGACPECLRKRSSVWALRAVYEAKAHVSNLMVTLTYDTFKRDDSGNIIYKNGVPVENPVDPDLKVNKRHIQLFIKRLRKWYSTKSSEKIKYICCAEYGSHTHRAHYHLILFGVTFDDIRYYKKSKRGNVIYMSNTLTGLWKHGICTVDSIVANSAVARYCTKYCAKSRSDKTFMLCSQRIGLNDLMRDFNGINYMIDGREFPVPRVVWQEYIMTKYARYSSIVSPRYVNMVDKEFSRFDPINAPYLKACADRKRYRYLRDRDPLYVKYLDYWQKRGELFESMQLPIIKRIYLLDDSKFHNYKTAALDCYAQRHKFNDLVGEFVPVVAPNSGCISAYLRYKDKVRRALGLNIPVTCPSPSRPNRASDTKRAADYEFNPFNEKKEHKSCYELLTFSKNQCIIDVD